MNVTGVEGRTYVYAVRKTPGADTYEGRCSCGFDTAGWPTKADAEDRIALHAQEHETGEPMSELRDFEIEQELVVPLPTPTVASLWNDEEDDEEDE